MELNLFFNQVQREIEATLKQLLLIQDLPENQLYEAMGYSCLGGGKRYLG